jgi:hypothetical protein
VKESRAAEHRACDTNDVLTLNQPCGGLVRKGRLAFVLTCASFLALTLNY